MKAILFTSISIFILSIDSFKYCLNNFPGIKNNCEADTLYSNFIEFDDNLIKQNNKLLLKYSSKFGIFVHRELVVKDSLAIDFNEDGFIDTIAVFSPIELENPEIILEKSKIKSKRRFVVEIVNQKGHSIIGNIYQNLVSNVGGVLSKYSGMFKTDNGFKIIHESGSNYAWTYEMEFKTNPNGFVTLKQISKICSYNENSVIKKYNYENYPINKINFIDTLNIQCGCDSFWRELEYK